MPDLRLAGLAARFVGAGLLNTAAGGAAILILDLGLGVPPGLANLGGYLAGFLLSWFLHRRFVFRSSEAGVHVKARYLAATLCAYVANQGALHAVLALAGDAPPARFLAQATGVATYAALQFALLRTWVFRQAEADARRS